MLYHSIMRFAIFCLLICPFSVFAQYTSSLPVIAYDNCELDPVYEWGGDRTRKWSYWTGANHILPGKLTTASMTRSRQYVRRGAYAYKSRITKDLTYSSSSNTMRSELTFSTPDQTAIGWRWAAVSIYLPSDFCDDNSPMTIAFNTKAAPEDYVTPFRLDVKNGRYIVVRAGIQANGAVNGEVSEDIGPVDKGVWIDWVYNRNFAMDASGYLKLYKNGVLVFSYNGPNWVTGERRHPEGYLHIGLYKWPWLSVNGEGWGPTVCNNPIEVYYDEFKFGDANATLQTFIIASLPRAIAPSASPSLKYFQAQLNPIVNPIAMAPNAR
jgi:hypothetical protein